MSCWGKSGLVSCLPFLQPSVVFAEMFPARLRETAMGIGYNLPQAVLGGLTPISCTWLVHHASSDLAPGLFVLAAAVLSLAASVGIGTPGGEHTD